MVESAQSKFDLALAIEKLKHPEESVRSGALGQILAAGAGAQALPQMIECLIDASERVRRAAVVVLGETGPVAISALIGALDEKQPSAIRVLTASVLARWGGEAAPAVNPLIVCLGATEEDLRQVAGLALGKIGAPAVPGLRKLLANPDHNIRAAAADALGHAGPAAVNALEDLKHQAVAEPGPALRVACAAAIVKISQDPKAGLPALLEALEDKDENIRTRALDKIGEMRTLARGSEPALIERLRDPVATVRSGSALGLARIGANSPDAIAALTSTLHDPEAEVRASAAMALAALGPSAAPALSELRTMQKDQDARAAAVAGAAIERIAGKKSSPKLAKLTENLPPQCSLG